MLIRKVNLQISATGKFVACFHNALGKVNVNSLRASLDASYLHMKCCEDKVRAKAIYSEVKSQIIEQEQALLDCLIAEAVCNKQSHILMDTESIQLLKKYTYTDVFNDVCHSSLSTITRYLRDDCLQAVVNGRTYVLNNLLEHSGDHEKIYLALEGLRQLSSDEDFAIDKVSTQKVLDVLTETGNCHYRHRALHSVMKRAKQLYSSERSLHALLAALD